MQEKIETRYGTALGARELDAETPEGRTAEEQYEASAARRRGETRGDPRLDAPAGQRLTQALTLRRRRSPWRRRSAEHLAEELAV